MSLSREQQRAVRAWGSGALSALAWPERHEPGQGSASSTRGLFAEEAWIDYGRKGLVIGPLGGPAIVTVAWPQLYRHARSLPPGLVERIRAHQRRGHRLALQGHRLFTLAPGYGYLRSPEDRNRAEYGREAWEALRETVMPLKRRARRLLAAEADRLLDEAFPLAVNDEPADLLELLAAEG